MKCFIEKVNTCFSGVPATLIGGVFLILSFVLPRAGIAMAADPAWVTVVICGIPLIYLSVWRIIHNPGISKISSALLITIAMFAAVAIGDLFAAGEVAFIMALGAILEDMITNRAKKGLHKLLQLTPQQGRRISGEKEEMIPAAQICRGDILRVLPGETVPVDGVILTGETSVDQSIMTGESLPADKGPGDSLFCGTINRFGAVDMKATNVGRDSSLQKLISMVEEAENKKAPMARMADKAATWLVPLVVVIAIITGLVTKDAVRSVTLLVVFCPCALVLSTPTAIMAAIGQATKRGVIIKSGEALERMGKVDTLTFDKTGTLTYGRLQVSDIEVLEPGLEPDGLLAMTAAAEKRSEHPLGKAIVKKAAEKALSLPEARDFRMESGRGIAAQVQGRALLCGTEDYLKAAGCEISSSARQILEKLRTQGKASVLVAADGQLAGILGLSDILRPEAPAVVEKLRKLGTQVTLLTGDNEKTASYFASQVGISSVKAQLLPGDKVKAVEQLQQAGANVCMIGDGVNDAPALKTARVGVAMGCMGSDIAVDAADITLMSDDITRIPYLKRLSNATVATIKLSITLSMCINLCAVTLSIRGILNPTTGALVHNVGSCLVVLIAALLYDRKFD